MSLIARWREIPIPSRKTEYEGKHLLLLDNPQKLDPPREYWPAGYEPIDLTDSVVKLYKRRNAKETMHSPRDVSGWGSIRVLQILWRCVHCNMSHECYIPESWLEEGKAVFVEKVTEEV